MYSAIKLIENSQYARFGNYLGERHFFAIMLLAFFLHAMAAAIYYILPEAPIEEIPVRVLNVKLGGKADAAAITSADIKRLFSKRRLAEDSPQPQPVTAQTAAARVETQPEKPVVEKRPPQEAKKPETVKAEPAPEPKKVDAPKPVTETSGNEVARTALETPKPKAEITPAPKPQPEPKTPPKPEAVKAEPKPPAPPKMESMIQVTKNGVTQREVIRQHLPVAEDKTPRRYVRASQLTAQLGGSDKKGEGSVIGNSSAHKAEAQRRYTQTISLWIDKHKVYPEAARAAGEGGKVILRIRINRQGRILRYLLEKSSGSEAIDRAITQMIDAANPLPAVPVDYPDNKPYLEFLIPINFIP